MSTPLKQHYDSALIVGSTAPTLCFNRSEGKLTLSSQERNSLIDAKLFSIQDSVNKELQSYLSLKPGWDGYSASTFDENAVLLAQHIADFSVLFLRDERILPHEITPGPVGDGTIDLEISCKGKNLIFTVAPDVKEIQVFKDDSIARKEEVIPFETTSLGKELNWLVD